MNEDKHRLIEVKAVKDDGTGQAVIATLNVKDLDDEVTLPGAFGEQHVKVFSAHNTHDVTLGKARIFEDGETVRADFALNLAIGQAKDLHEALKFDLASAPPLQEWSYGFRVLEERRGQHGGDDVRFLEKVQAFEISPVMRGAGIGTGTVHVKDAKENRTFAEEITDAAAAIESVLARAEAIKTVRGQDGRDLSPERIADIESLMSLKAQMDALLEMQTELTALAAKQDPAVARRLFAEFTRYRLDHPEAFQ